MDGSAGLAAPKGETFFNHVVGRVSISKNWVARVGQYIISLDFSRAGCCLDVQQPFGGTLAVLHFLYKKNPFGDAGRRGLPRAVPSTGSAQVARSLGSPQCECCSALPVGTARTGHCATGSLQPAHYSGWHIKGTHIPVWIYSILFTCLTYLSSKYSFIGICSVFGTPSWSFGQIPPISRFIAVIWICSGRICPLLCYFNSLKNLMKIKWKNKAFCILFSEWWIDRRTGDLYL